MTEFKQSGDWQILEISTLTLDGTGVVSTQAIAICPRLGGGAVLRAMPDPHSRQPFIEVFLDADQLAALGELLTDMAVAG